MSFSQEDLLLTVGEASALMEEYRTNEYTLQRLREIRADLSVLNVQLGDGVGHLYQLMSDAEYHRKKEESVLYLFHRKSMGAGDSEKRAVIDSEQYYITENEYKGLYKRLDNQFRAIAKVLDSMASKLKEIDVSVEPTI